MICARGYFFRWYGMLAGVRFEDRGSLFECVCRLVVGTKVSWRLLACTPLHQSMIAKENLTSLMLFFCVENRLDCVAMLACFGLLS